MYLEMSISEFKAWCVNHKNELKKVQSLRIQTSKGTTSHDNLKSFGVKILELEARLRIAKANNCKHEIYQCRVDLSKLY